jgi:predicted nuclease of restriction endonuclease-like RecB superfamily
MEISDARDLQAFAKIVEIMSFVDDIQEMDSEEIRERVQSLCELPPAPHHSMGVEEVVFWAGVATGMDVSRRAEEAVLEQSIADKLLLYSSLFAHSTKTAVVDLALQQLDPTQ